MPGHSPGTTIPLPAASRPEGGPVHDLLVAGGGINGAGIARDAAGRGLSVLLVEQDDLACATSSASTKLIHGGLRYLEHFEFRLVREALIEREVLLRNAPHVIWPLRFVLPHERHLRPAWMIRLGLFLYDHLGGREILPGSRGVDLRRHDFGRALRPEFTRGFVYSDCWVQDARLVVLNAMDAAARGAEIRTRTRLCAAWREAAPDGGTLWRATLEDGLTGRRREVAARALVNASGPWAARLLDEAVRRRSDGPQAAHRLRLVKGSHIVVPRLLDGDHAYILQNRDRRIVFAIPYEERFTLIGTTDVPYDGDPSAAAISAEETSYLCDVANLHLQRQITPTDVVWSYAGVRPLYDEAGAANASAVSRDYVLDLDRGAGGEAPLLSVFGGKITTYRRLAEHALEKLGPLLDAPSAGWTHRATLPGGDLPDLDAGRFARELTHAHPWLPAAVARRYARSYGTLATEIIGGAGGLDGLGADLGGGLHEAEVEYLRRREWAMSADDILWRRSKLGLHLSPASRAALAQRFAPAPQPARSGAA